MNESGLCRSNLTNSKSSSVWSLKYTVCTAWWLCSQPVVGVIVAAGWALESSSISACQGHTQQGTSDERLEGAEKHSCCTELEPGGGEGSGQGRGSPALEAWPWWSWQRRWAGQGQSGSRGLVTVVMAESKAAEKVMGTRGDPEDPRLSTKQVSKTETTDPEPGTGAGREGAAAGAWEGLAGKGQLRGEAVTGLGETMHKRGQAVFVAVSQAGSVLLRLLEGVQGPQGGCCHSSHGASPQP